MANRSGSHPAKVSGTAMPAVGPPTAAPSSTRAIGTSGTSIRLNRRSEGLPCSGDADLRYRRFPLRLRRPLLGDVTSLQVFVGNPFHSGDISCMGRIQSRELGGIERLVRAHNAAETRSRIDARIGRRGDGKLG